MMTVCNPGTKWWSFPVLWNYTADAILSGAEPIYVHLRPPGFNFDVDELEEAFKQRPKALILCNPSNPSGKVFTLEELKTIAYFAEKYDTFVITDEVYEHIVYPPHHHIYFASLPGMFERTISCSSLSKLIPSPDGDWGIWLHPLTLLTGPGRFMTFWQWRCRTVAGSGSGCPEFGDDYYENLKRIYTEKRDFFLDGLDRLGLAYTVPQGAYYVMVDISEFGAKSDLEFCEWMAREVGVAAVPGSSFFRDNVNHLIRFHFAKKEETLAEAVKRLEKLKDKARERWRWQK